MTDERKQQLISEFGKHELTDAERAKTEGSYISLPSGNTHYEIRGEGELCVLIHGYAVGYFIYDRLADELVKNGYRVLRYDLLGRGLSERVKGKYNVELFVRQLEDIISALAGGESYILCTRGNGHFQAALLYVSLCLPAYRRFYIRQLGRQGSLQECDKRNEACGCRSLSRKARGILQIQGLQQMHSLEPEAYYSQDKEINRLFHRSSEAEYPDPLPLGQGRYHDAVLYVRKIPGNNARCRVS